MDPFRGSTIPSPYRILAVNKQKNRINPTGSIAIHIIILRCLWSRSAIIPADPSTQQAATPRPYIKNPIPFVTKAARDRSSQGPRRPLTIKDIPRADQVRTVVWASILLGPRAENRTWPLGEVPHRNAELPLPKRHEKHSGTARRLHEN